MQIERTRTKTLFHFDSGQHPGCTVLIRNAVIPGMTVTVVQDYDSVYDGTHRTPHEVKGMVRVFGQFFGWPGIASAKDLGPDHPVDVRVYAFDPMANKSYVMEVTAAYITNLVTHTFLAASWQGWRELNPPRDAEDAAKEQVDKPSRKRLHVTQVAPGMWFEAHDGTVVIRGDGRFCVLTRGAGVVVPDGCVWVSPEPNYEVTILPNFYNEMGRLFNIDPQWGYEDSPEKWPDYLAEWMERRKRFYKRVRAILNLHYADDVQVYGRISQLVNKERFAEYQAKREEAKAKDVVCTSEDTAHLGPWTTVRACLDCGVLVTGGPTRCVYCADKITQQEKRIDAATKLCCSPEIQAYIAYLEHLEQMEKKKPG